MSSSKQRPRRANYRHTEMMRNLCPLKESRRARKEAVDLARELGTSYDPPPRRGISAAAAPSNPCGPERWLIDTGSAFDLIGKQDVPEWCVKLATPTDGTVELSTANGRMAVTKEVLMQVGPFQ